MNDLYPIWLESEDDNISSEWPPDDGDVENEALRTALERETEDALELQLELDRERFKRRHGLKKPKLPPELARLVRNSERAARERIEAAARTPEQFENVVAIWDRMDQNRERRERYREVLRGNDIPLEHDMTDDGLIFPRWLMNPAQTQMMRGNFLDVIFDCYYEMHELTADPFLSNMVRHLKEEHKEILYFLAIRLYSTTKLGELRGQTSRNIRKVRVTIMKELQGPLYKRLRRLKDKGRGLTLREQEFIDRYEANALDADGDS